MGRTSKGAAAEAAKLFPRGGRGERAKGASRAVIVEIGFIARQSVTKRINNSLAQG